MSEWLPIETAPKDERVIVWGTGGIMIAVRDNLGNWRQRHHGPHRGTPRFWMPLPEPPQ